MSAPRWRNGMYRSSAGLLEIRKTWHVAAHGRTEMHARWRFHGGTAWFDTKVRELERIGAERLTERELDQLGVTG